MTPAPLLSTASRVRVLGVDPGAVRLGWCLLERDRASVCYLASGVLELEPSDPGFRALRLAGRKLLETHAPTAVALERVGAVYQGPRFSPKVATGLVLAAWSGGELAGLAAARGLEVRTLTHTAAKIACGAPAGDGRAVAAALRARVNGWPDVVSDHERDGAAVALAVILSDGSCHG